MTFYKLEMQEHQTLQELPDYVAHHYKYQGSPTEMILTKEEKQTAINFPFKSFDPDVLSGKKTLVNIYNFSPAGMKKIKSKELFNLPFHTSSSLMCTSVVDLTHKDSGAQQRHQSGHLFFFGDNLGYAVLKGWHDNEIQNIFYAFGCIDHELYMTESSYGGRLTRHVCRKCGWSTTMDSSD